MRKILYVIMYLLPKNYLSRLIGSIFSIKVPKFIRMPLFKAFVRIFNIDLSESSKHLLEFTSIQNIFTRKLKAGSRMIDINSLVVSPSDGKLTAISQIKKDKLFSIKGQEYTLRELLKDEHLAHMFEDGFFAQIYLSPKDYHRFHMPVDGDILKTSYIPGHLWPVNNWGVHNIPKLFCENERIVTYGQFEYGHFAHIAVGATIVGKIKLEYSDIESNVTNVPIQIKHEEAIKMQKGDPLGYFAFGSTIILLLSNNKEISLLPRDNGNVCCGQWLWQKKPL